MASFLKSLFGGSSSPEENAAKEDKKKFEILKYDGLRALRMGRADYAEKCFVEALKLEDDLETMNYLHQIYMHNAELDEAIALLQRMIGVQPDNVEFYIMLSHAYYMKGNFKEAETSAQKATTIDKENATTFYLLAKALHAQKNDIMAIAHLTKAIVLCDNYTDARMLRAEILLKMNQLKEAAEDVNVVLTNHPEEESATLLSGKVNEAEGNHEKAEELYRAVIEQNPFNEQAFVRLGQLYIAQQKPEEAITLFDDAIELNPHCAEAYHERGRARLMLGDQEGSMADMKAALEIKPDELNGTFSNQADDSSKGFLGV